MRISAPHHFDTKEAMNRVQSAVQKMKSQYGGEVSQFQEQWDKDSGKFTIKAYGISVKASVQVTPQEVSLSGNLPLIALPFKGRIESWIRGILTKTLA